MKKGWILLTGIFLCVLLAGCGKEEEKEIKYPVLKMMSMGNEPGHMDEIYRQLDELTEEELGIDVRISFYPWEDEAETVQKLVHSNSFDIYVYGTPFGSEELARKGAFLNMEPYLESVPGLVEYYRSQGIDLLNRENVYSVPRLQSSTGYGFFYREDLRKKWGLEPVEDFHSLESYLYRTKEEYPENAPINDKRFFDSLLSLTAGEKYRYLGYGMAIRWDSGELIYLPDVPEYREALDIAGRWYRDGIISEDVLYLQNNNTMVTLEMMKQDKAAVEFCNHFPAICSNYVMALCEKNPEWELGWLDYDLLNHSCYDTYFTGAGQVGLAVDSKCRCPESAMLLLEKMHTDSRYYNLLSYGVEGIHYVTTESGTLSYEGIPADNIFRGQIGLEQDTMMLTPQYPGNWDAVYRDVRERFTQMRTVNGKSAAPAFSIDTDAYPDCQSAIKAWSDSKLRQMLETGTAEDIDGAMEKFKEELDQTGYDDFVEAVREEWERFRNNNSGN